MKKIIMAIGLFCFSLSLFSQNNISGIINDYARVNGINTGSCSATITLDPVAAVNFNVGDTVLMIQMQGATINTSNSAAFGDVTSLGNAGNFEKNYITAKSGSVVTFGFDLSNTYDVAGNVQLVNIPFYSGNVNVVGVLSAADWDGNTGGVLIFSTDGDVTLTASIDVSNRGFRGGANVISPPYNCNFLSNRDAYSYPLNDERGAGKGEGIALFIAGQQAGRGKQANGGGGGNDHNAGGAGGSNFTAGGNGGINDEPGAFNCDGDYPGRGGAALDYSGNRLFMGGGGGAGHGNNAAYVAPDGAGIVIISANTVLSSPGTIIVDGTNGTAVTNDGGIGGSGAGSILLDVNSWSAAIILSASGGNGGNTININNRCYGPGGGGGVGAILHNQATITGQVVIANPGTAGVVTTSTNACNGSNLGATAGGTSAAPVLANKSLPIGPPAGVGPALTAGTLADQILCEGQNYVFNIGVSGTAGESYQWQIDSTGGVWEDLAVGPNYANVDTNNSFQIVNVVPSVEAFYRLMVFNGCDTVYSSPTTFMSVISVPVINVQPTSQSSCQASDASFTAEVTNGTSFQWQQLNGSWTDLVDNAVFSGTTTDSMYLTNIPASLDGAIFRLVISSPCGNTFSNPVFLNFNPTPITIDSLSADLNICAGEDSIMWVSATGQVDAIQWQVNMGSGFVNLVNGINYQNVSTDTLSLLNVSTSQSGYVYQAVLSNTCGTTEIAGPINLTVFQAPNVALTDTIRACEGQGVFITPTSVTGTGITYQWQIFTGGSWQNLIDTGAYSNTQASFLAIGGSIVNASLNNTEYRLVINTSCGIANSNGAFLFVTPRPTFTVPPANDTVCFGDTAVLLATVANGATYQWQSNAGGPFTNLSNNATYNGVNTPNLTINNVSPAEIGISYRLRVLGDPPCGNFNSATAQVYIGGDSVNVTNTSSSFTYCPGLDTSLFVSYAGTADTIIWQVDAGSGFTDLSADAYHSNFDTDSLQITGMDASLDGNIYRALLANDCGSLDTSDLIVVNLNSPAPIVYSSNQVACEGDSIFFFANPSSPVVSYEWQIWNGSAYVAITPGPNYQGLNGDTLIISPVALSMNGDSFNVQIIDSCGNSIDAPNPLVLNVNPNVVNNQNVAICSSDSLVLSDGTVVNTAGTYYDTIAIGSAAGCDSLVVYDLSILPDTSFSEAINICSGDSFQLSDGSFINTSGIYNDTIFSGAANGCDSVHIINLTVDPLIQTASFFTICFGDSLVLSNGSVITSSGIYNDTILAGASNGCDSVHIFDVTAPPLALSNNNVNICFGDSFQLIDGSFVNMSGTYNDTLFGVTDEGCDSIVVVNLTVDTLITSNSNISICAGDSFQLSDGSFVNMTGIYNDTLSGGAANGCDSLHVINLTVDSLIQSNANVNICFGDSLQLSDGSFVNSSGTYNDTIFGGSAGGCDSLHIIDLTVDPLIQTVSSEALCFGDSLQLSDGSYVFTSGVYNDTLSGGAANGCDSIHVINLLIAPLIQSNDAQVLCFGDSLQLSDGSFVDTAGTYNDTLVGGAANGCDSVYVVDLSFFPLDTTSQMLTLCFGDSFQLSDGSFVNMSGIYNDTIFGGAANGCDSIHIIDLTIDTLIQGSSSVTLCFGDSLGLSDGSFVNTTGIYNDTIAGGAANGCDSLHVFDLTIPAQIQFNEVVNVCFGDSFQLSGGSFVNTTGIYNDTIFGGAANGCDSVHVIDLTVDPLIQSNASVNICFGDSFQLSDGSFVNATGIYNDTLTGGAANGCDSIHIVDLSVDPLIQTSASVSICFGDSLQLSDGSFVDTSGIYNDTLAAGAANGCDSIHVIDLTVDPLIQTVGSQTLCFGDSLQLSDGSYVNMSGIYNDTLSGGAANGCDSIHVINLLIAPLIQSNDAQVLCFGDSLQLSNGSFVDTAGTYNDTLVGGAANGCDSVYVVDLSFFPLNTTSQALTLCFGDSLGLSDGSFVNTTGIYNDTIPGGAANGCDSIHIIDLTIDTLIQGSSSVTLCFGDSLGLSDGSFVNTTGIFNDTIAGGAANGCDSLHVFDLTIPAQIQFNEAINICFGDSFQLSDGSFINASGIYNDTIFGGAANGCDSVHIIDLTVDPLIQSNASVSICFGDSFQLSDGSFVNTSGIYNDTLVAGAANACDSIHIIDLTVDPLIQTNASVNICFGDSLQLSDGSFVDTSGIYNDTLLAGAANGCDSIYIIDLTVDPLIQTVGSQTLCFGDSLQLSDGSYVNMSGIYNDTLSGGAANGCDSIHVINLLIAPLIQSNDAQVLCFGDSLQLSNGSFVDTAGTYNDTLVGGAANGCDSVYVVDLSFFPLDTTSQSVTLCFGDSFQLSDGSFVEMTGIYNDTIFGGAANGCDSIHIIDLIIDTLIQGSSSVTLCFGDSLGLSDGSFVNTTGIYNDTIAGGAANGCDSLHVFDLTIPAQIQSNQTLNICFGDSFQLADGSFVNASGIYNDTIVGGAANGCDSVHIIDLTVDPLIQTNAIVNICFGDSFQLSDGSFVNTSGIYNDTLVAGAANGCDSIHIIDLTVDPLIQTNATVNICFGDSLQLSDGSFVNSSGIYNDTLVAGALNGCDSIYIIDLTVDPLITDTVLTDICAGDSLVLSNGTVVNSTGVYQDTLVAANNCDSILIIDLTVLPIPINIDTQTICDGSFYILPNGDTATTTGIYADTLIAGAANGCDSIVQTDLVVLPNPDTLIVDSFCSGLSYTLASGSVVTSPGTYNDTLFASASNGCDSLITYNLTFFAIPPAIVQEDTICFNEVYNFFGTPLTVTGLYEDTIAGSTGCDSLVAVDLFVRPANSIVQEASSVLLCDGDDALFYAESALSNVTYQWSANGALMPGETNDTLTITNVSIANSGVVYQLEVISLCDTIFSSAMQLNVRSFANILTNPDDTSVCEGESATFNASVDIPVAQFQWYENGVLLAGANAASYSIPNVSAAQDGAQFFVEITDSCGNLDSSLVAILNVTPNGTILGESADQTICAGEVVTFYFDATGPNISYQWLENGVAMPGETNDTLVLVNTTASMNGFVYSCQATTDCNNLISSAMVLTVNDTSIVASQSTDIEQCGGFSFDVFIDATGIATYQWQINQGGGFVNLTDGVLGGSTTQITGSNTATLTVSNYDLSISGAQFQVITTVFCGNAPVFTPVNVTITSPETGIVTLEDTVLCQREVNPIFVPYVDAGAQWSNGDFGQFLVPESTGDFIVNYTDANGCPRQDTIFIELEDCIAKCILTAPTGYTPNGDGMNDIFRAIYTCELSFFEMQMFNRYGEMVFMTNDPAAGWDGIFRGENAEVGVYTWYITYTKEGSNKKEDLRGNVTLVR